MTDSLYTIELFSSYAVTYLHSAYMGFGGRGLMELNNSLQSILYYIKIIIDRLDILYRTLAFVASGVFTFRE